MRRPPRTSGMSLVEIVLVGAICVVMAVPAIALLVSSRQGIATTWDETVARHLAAEALDWAECLPTDGMRGPLVVEDSPLGSYRQARLADDEVVIDPSFVHETYEYPPSFERFHRRLEVVDASPEPGVPMLKATVVVAWTEPAIGRVRRVELWRLLGP